MKYNCAHCAQRLESAPVRSAEGWYIPCPHCGALNLIIPVFKLVNFR